MAIAGLPSVGVRPALGNAQASSNGAPNVLPITWLPNDPNDETAGIIKKALEIAKRANLTGQDSSSQNSPGPGPSQSTHTAAPDLQLIQQNLQMNFKMDHPDASAINQQRMQLEWDAMQLNKKMNDLELAASQQSMMLHQRAIEVANMEQSSRHQAIEQILRVECQV